MTTNEQSFPAVDQSVSSSQRSGLRMRSAEDNREWALKIAEDLLLADPGDPDAKAAVLHARMLLLESLLQAIGPLGQIPVVVMDRNDLQNLRLDGKAHFLLSFMDSGANLESIIDASAMSLLDCLRALHALMKAGAVGLSEAA
jgi:hypothetical protein